MPAPAVGREGARIIVTGIDGGNANSVCKDITAQGDPTGCWQLDVADADAVNRVFDASDNDTKD